MNTKQKRNVSILILVVLVLAIFFGYRAWQINKIESAIENDGLSTGLFEEPLSYAGSSYLVPPSQLYASGSDLPAIDDPVYTTVSDADTYLSDEVFGVHVEVNGEHRFYSYQILNWHLLVNDTFNGVDLLVSNCSLCHSPSVFEVSEEFESAALVYNNNQLLSDRATGSTWHQIRGTAVAGERTGEQLSPYQHTTMSWGDWKERHPDGEVLSTDTGYVRDYGQHPYGAYDTSKLVYFPLNSVDEKVSQKWVIDGLAIGNEAIAISRDIMRGVWVYHGVLSDTSIVVFYDTELGISRVFDAVIDGTELRFTYDNDSDTFTDDQTGSTWTAEGLAVSGSYSGTQLTQIQTQESNFLCWHGTYPTSQSALIDVLDKHVEEEATVEE